MTDEPFSLALGETPCRIGRLDEAPRVYQGKRRRRSGMRKPVSVGLLCSFHERLFARISGFGSKMRFPMKPWF